MSNAPHGPGWWQASNNRWYPPESHPSFRPPPPPSGYRGTPPTTAAYAGPPPTGPTPPSRRLWPWVGAGGFGFLLLIGIIGAIASPERDEKVVATESIPTSEAIAATVPSTPVAPTTVAPPATVATTLAPTAPPTTAAPVTAAPAPPPTPTALMPDVVCMNLQDAQDLIQTTGVFFSRSNDATGQGRMQVLDANWLVVGQNPPPGTPIGEGDAVLDVVKYGEPNFC